MKEEAKSIYSENELKQITKFSIKKCYQLLVGEFDRVHWERYIWNRLVVPKHRFISWFIMLEKLRTTDRLVVSVYVWMIVVYYVQRKNHISICSLNVIMLSSV